MEDVILKKTRQEIYDSIWSIGTTATAKKYGISYINFKAQIDAANIPTPSMSYWALLSKGNSPEKTQLTGDTSEIVELHTLTEWQRQINEERKHPAPISLSPEKLTVELKPVPKAVQQLLDKKPSPVDDFEYSYQFKELETVTIYRQVYNVYRRERLYEEVWGRPMVEVAKHYKVSDATIRKVCKDLNVPIPTAGHWNKVRAGNGVEQEPLPPDGLETKQGMQNAYYYDKDADMTSALEFMSEDERSKVLEAASNIRVPADNERIPRKITSGVTNQEGISQNSIKRVAQITTALYNALVPLGCNINDNLCFTISGEEVKISFSEAQDRLDHKLTKEENMQLLRYEEDKRRYSWTSKPNIRKYDYEYNGKLTLSCGRRSWRDGKITIEERLPEVIIALFAEAERVRLARLEKEEAERKRQEEERLREERRQRYNDEVDCTLALINEADDYQIACKIRAYIDAMKKAHPNEDISEWVEWANKKADWFDPCAEYKDSILGKRGHSNNPEQKKLEQKRYSWW